MVKHNVDKYWSARFNRKDIPIKPESVVTVKAEVGRDSTELLFIVDGKVYGCLVEECPEPEPVDPFVSTEKVCPYCMKPVTWDQWKENWKCRMHGSFDESQLAHGV